MARPPYHRRLWSSRLFWKLLLACAGLNLIAAAVFALILTDRLPHETVAQAWGLVALVCLLVLGLTYWLVGHIIRPVATLTEAAEAIAAGDYEHRVYVANGTSLASWPSHSIA